MRWIGIIGASLLALYFLAILIIVYNPRRSRSSDDAMGIGCAWFLAICVAILAGILALAMHFKIDWLIKLIGLAAIFPLVPITTGLVLEAYNIRRKSLARRERPFAPDSLADRLAGQTHVIEHSLAAPPWRWLELRYYAPDGRLLGYRQEGDRIQLMPVNVTWRVEAGRLETVNTGEPDKKNRYALKIRGDGQIVYYLSDLGENADGPLAFTTCELRARQPTVSADDPPGE